MKCIILPGINRFGYKEAGKSSELGGKGHGTYRYGKEQD